jgi:hypothetical protein
MIKNAAILYEGNKLVQENASVKQYAANATGDFCTLPIDNDFTVVMKEKKGKNTSNEKVRMIAGDIARTLGKNKVEEAVVNSITLQAFLVMNTFPGK